MKNVAFTLSEVLITLGVIGIIAAMIIPSLLTAYAKHRVETQVVKFYSMINQTVRMSVAENGTPEGWITETKDYTYDENVEFLKTYIFPYLKVSGYEKCKTKHVCITNLDGTFWSFNVDGNGGDIGYYIDGDESNISSKNTFYFQFNKYVTYEKLELNSNNFVEAYSFDWDGTKEGLAENSGNNRGCYKGCTKCSYCTKMLQLNSWKITSDYPW